MTELAHLDIDYSGEQQFARLTLDSLKAFAHRHSGDLPVADAYSAAIRTLEQLGPVLAGAERRSETAQSVAATAQMAREVARQTAEQAISQAQQWVQAAPRAEPKPPPESEPEPAPEGV